ncbi:MAG: hypothetical protein J07HR59_01517 [Halorubrum sp. J07HR59]|nr:MAG: hypothetical protein J07HR59_01517 [Halorubrum sp. J07HR59]
MDAADDVRQLVTDPTDEQKVILVATLGIAGADRVAFLDNIPFIVRTTMAVGAGFSVLFPASLLITGQLVPPDPPEEHEAEDSAGEQRAEN